MQGSRSFNRESRFVRSDDSRSIRLNGAGGFPLGVSRLRSFRDGTGLTEEHLIEDAFLISLQLHDYQGDIYHNGRRLPFQHQPRGEILIYDYRDVWVANIRSAFDCVNLHVPRATLNTVIADEHRGSLEGLKFAPGVPQADQTIVGLVHALIPALNAPNEPNQLFVDHVGWAMSAYVARTFGDLVVNRPLSKGHLAPWQERRAKEMIDASLSGEVALSALAAECGISTSHFARAFRLTTGVAPYQWLLGRRIDRAKTLLMDQSLQIAAIAAICGFSDQSHLTRVFTRAVGEPPAAWRRRVAA